MNHPEQGEGPDTASANTRESMFGGVAMAPRVYQLRFTGEADSTVRAAFPEFTVSVAHGVTVLSAELSDQAALHGAIDRIQSLGLELVDLHLVVEGNGGASSPLSG
jgi:hypothetical protein